MSHVYLVIHKVSNEGDTILGVFTDYIKARKFDLQYLSTVSMFEDIEWTEVRKVETDNPCSYYDGMYDLGELV